MANIYDWNALDTKIKSRLSDSPDLSTRTNAFTAVALEALLGISRDEAEDSITDGGNDRGVDAIFIDDRPGNSAVHLFQTKCVTEFEKSKNNFPGSEVDKISSFVEDLLRLDPNLGSTVNAAILRKLDDINDVIQNPGGRVAIHFLGNMAPLADHEIKRITNIFSRYKDVEFLMHDLDQLSDFFLEKRTPRIDRNLQVVDVNFFERSDRDLRGFVCTVSAKEIVTMITSDSDQTKVDEKIFDQNVRVYLQRANKVNRSIIDSAISDTNHMFWYQNNGITITCDKVDVPPSKRSPTLRLNNLQIVNGGQTSNCLFEAAQSHPEKIEDVLVLVRIIETTSESVKSAIAESTNSQTPINVRDLRANDRAMRQLEESFLHRNIFFERKNNQHASEEKMSRIDALDAGQAYLAYGIGLPETAKKDRGRIFGDLFETVFSHELTVDKLLTSIRLFEEIGVRKSKVRKKIRDNDRVSDSENALIDGAFHVLFAIRQIAVREGIDLWDLDRCKNLIDEAIVRVGSVYSDQKMKISSFSSNRFFKDPKTKDMITLICGQTQLI